jgi:hypothetical protein
VRLILKNRDLNQFSDKLFGVRLRGNFGHARPALLIGRLIVPWPDIDA